VPIPKFESTDQLPYNLGPEDAGYMVNVAGVPHMWNGVSWIDIDGRRIVPRPGQLWDGEKWLDDTTAAFNERVPVSFFNVPDVTPATPVDMVNHPPHYLNKNAVIVADEHETFVAEDGRAMRPVECVELMRRIKDPRLATAFAYIWRVSFGGKDNDHEDVEKTVWWLTDWLEHKI
jgi:hypothetical protein